VMELLILSVFLGAWFFLVAVVRRKKWQAVLYALWLVLVLVMIVVFLRAHYRLMRRIHEVGTSVSINTFWHNSNSSFHQAMPASLAD
jgi:asparagine N-glycosylation enzyme membrane subunit Stt3